MKPSLTGTVISAGRMMRAVKVRSSKQTWNAKIQKVRPVRPSLARQPPHRTIPLHPNCPPVYATPFPLSLFPGSPPNPSSPPQPSSHPFAALTLTWEMEKQHFTHPTTHLVADPTSALRAGDVIRMAPAPHSRHIHHVVAAIIAPWGVPIDERPAVLTRAEREARRGAKRERKVARKEEEKGRWRVGKGGEEGEGEVDGGEEGDRTRRAGGEVGGIQRRLEGEGERRAEQARM